MALLNLGAGLSSMGSAIAQTAGSAALEMQKSQLEQQRDVLLNQLTAEREHTGRVEQGQIQGGLQQQQQAATSELTHFQEGAATNRTVLEQAGAGARAQTQAQAELGSASISANAEPPEVKSAKWFTTATPEQKHAYEESILAKAGMPPSMYEGPASSTTPSTGGGTGGNSAPTTASAPGQVSPINAQGQQILDNLPTQIKSQVTAMIDGRARPFQGTAMRDPINRQMTMLAHQIDPTWDETTWNARNKMRSDWDAGQTSNLLQSLDQAAMHADHFDEVAHNLNNSSFVPYNKVTNTLAPFLDDPRINDFNRTNEAFAAEMGKVYKGTGVLGEKELEDWKNTNSLNAGPTTLSHTGTETMQLFDGRLDALENKWHTTFGPNVQPPAMLSPDAQEIYDRLTHGTGKYASSKTGWQTNGPPSNDIKTLNDNPSLAPKFDAKYGDGAAQKYLGRWANRNVVTGGSADQAAAVPGPAINRDDAIQEAVRRGLGKVGPNGQFIPNQQ